MPRLSRMYAREARRRAMLLPNLSRANIADPLHPEDARLTCPYCHKRLNTETGRNRHIILRASCRARHQYAISGGKHKRKRESESDVPFFEPPETEPPTKRLRTEEEEGPPVAGPSRLPDPVRTVPSLASEREGLLGCNRSAGNGSYTEEYPIKTAGAPIGARSMSEEDLQKYLESCGALGDSDLFETAEIMMTTGLSGRGRSRHLKAPAYKQWKGKGKAVWNDNTALLNDIDKLPSGPEWMTEE
ncbi:hypothetical protein FRC07_008960, partial [Ceratobasidium sp. 392]